MAIQPYNALPRAVHDAVMADEVSGLNQSIRAAFGLSSQQYDYLLDTIRQVVMKGLPVLEVPNYLAKMPDASAVDMRNFMLRIALDRLWPLQEYLGNVDTLIRRLGGTVPPVIPLPSEAAEEDIGGEGAVGTISELGGASEVLRSHPEYRELYLTQKPLKDDDDRLKSPTAANWLTDYLHTMGAGGSSSLKRSQYTAHSRNVMALNEEEKRNLMNFLISYEENRSMYFHVVDDKYLVVTEEESSTELNEKQGSEIAKNLPEALSFFEEATKNLEQSLRDRASGIEVEIGGDTKRLHDIFWDALGFGESERALAAINVLIDRHVFFDMLKSDRRFTGIVSREIEARWGLEAKNLWDKDLTRQVALAVFWRLILVDKLELKEDRAAVAADFFRTKLGQRESSVFLDLASGNFSFRPIEYRDKRLQFKNFKAPT